MHAISLHLVHHAFEGTLMWWELNFNKLKPNRPLAIVAMHPQAKIFYLQPLWVGERLARKDFFLPCSGNTLSPTKDLTIVYILLDCSKCYLNQVWCWYLPLQWHLAHLILPRNAAHHVRAPRTNGQELPGYHTCTVKLTDKSAHII
jgi:hypothetical protein